MTTSERFHQITKEIKSNATWMRGLKDDIVLPTLCDIAKHYGGEVFYTGGGIDVTVIRLSEHEIMGVGDECLVRYVSTKHTKMEDIFWEMENQEEIIDLWDGE